ncbi:DeoR/GlpR family transcriptional regulator of sugar metabolism [Herbaspirillum sp. 1173]|uniref:DeoR/GlpR family DNA-binding transcription regulator n=1 Tax=Herbaspirillum sp. 1173 TaxID=2817734 RepID=UPI00285EBB72|nr:DeoR/GlpR family DNA-binding transcription regulator [Herbaspirillum sp. 1173]MDR6743314.1 DeoR/GlpR family transcriptional regulator of sugar metabolism [Herbaspirillum sp. 1173]
MEPEESATAGAALPTTRHAQIVEYVNTNHQATVAELMNLFKVGRDTIRRDLIALEERRLLVRSHGGAVALESLVGVQTTLSSRMDAQVAAKKRIAKRCAELIRDSETIALNGGSTTAYLAAELADKRYLTVVTNSLRVPLVLNENAVRNIYLVGGNYSVSAQVTIGLVGFADIAGISADTAIIGVTGLDTNGFTIGTLEEALVTKEMMSFSRRTVLVADNSKLNNRAFALIAPLSAADVLVTDQEPTGDIGAALQEAGVQVIVTG